jgi:hypothetical protein
MAFRLPHSLQDALRYTLRSQYTGLESRVGSNSIDHRGAFADALGVLLCQGFTRDSHECERQ